MSGKDQDRKLGMGHEITRRDFLNGISIGVGTSLVGASPTWLEAFGVPQSPFAPEKDYARLDDASSPIRIRLNSTAVKARHMGDPANAKEVEITYVRGGQAHRIRGANCILACYNMIIPYLCPELSDKQKEALAYCVKIPLVYCAPRKLHPERFVVDVTLLHCAPEEFLRSTEVTLAADSIC